jgi:hypothetical protein
MYWKGSGRRAFLGYGLKTQDCGLNFLRGKGIFLLLHIV